MVQTKFIGFFEVSLLFPSIFHKVLEFGVLMLLLFVTHPVSTKYPFWTFLGFKSTTLSFPFKVNVYLLNVRSSIILPFNDIVPLIFLFSNSTLLLSFIAVYKTTQNSSSLLIKISLFLAWGFLSFLIISEEYAIVHLPEFITYITGFTLAGLHIYNKKYCQCNDGDCCVD